MGFNFSIKVDSQVTRKLGLNQRETRITLKGNTFSGTLYQLRSQGASLLLPGMDMGDTLALSRNILYMSIEFFDPIAQERKPFTFTCRASQVNHMVHNGLFLVSLELEFTRGASTEFLAFVEKHLGQGPKNALSFGSEDSPFESILLSRGIKYRCELQEITEHGCVFVVPGNAVRIRGGNLLIVIKIRETGEIHEFFGQAEEGESEHSLSMNFEGRDQAPNFIRGIRAVRNALVVRQVS